VSLRTIPRCHLQQLALIVVVSWFSVPSDCEYMPPRSPATLVAASEHVAPSGRRSPLDFPPSVRSLDMKTPSRISVHARFLLAPARVCFLMRE
jgi:hypothetical protein